MILKNRMCVLIYRIKSIQFILLILSKKIAELLASDFFAEHDNNTTRYLYQDQKNNRELDTP